MSLRLRDPLSIHFASPPALYPASIHSVLGYYNNMCWWSSMSNRPRSTRLQNCPSIQQRQPQRTTRGVASTTERHTATSKQKVTASGQFSDRIFPRHLGFGSTSSPFGGGTTGSSGGGLFGNTSSSFGSGGGMHLHELFPFCMDFAGFLAIWTSSGALSITIFLPSSLEGEPKLGALHGFRNSRNTFISTSRLLAAGNLYRSTHLCFYVDSRLYM